jgi:hypothetical protein
MRHIHTLKRTVAAALAIAAVTAPVAVGQPSDQRSPDSRAEPAQSEPAQDLRSPDTRDAALAQERYYTSYADKTDAAEARIAARQDLRSPDTRDIADGRQYPPTPTVVTLKKINAPEPVPASGFDWLAAVAGAATTVGVILLMTASAVIVTRLRAHRDQPVAAT